MTEDKILNKGITIMIVGRPNVGKSTLLNRIIGKKKVIVDKTPGVTRDLIMESTQWEGVSIQIIDTGGLYHIPGRRREETNLPETFDEELQREILSGIEAQISAVDAVFFMVDARSGINHTDIFFVDFLKKKNIPVWVIANKIEDPKDFMKAYEFYEWGFPVYSISAEAGIGIGDLLSAAIRDLKPRVNVAETIAENIIPVAIVGRPNVGKSTLVNTLLGRKRMITTNVPGTTRDAIDIDVNIDDVTLRLIDTAGIFKKKHLKERIEQIAMMQSERAIKRADIAVLLLDAEEGPKEQDHHIAEIIEEKGTCGIIVINKWDVLKNKEKQLEEWKRWIRNNWRVLEMADILRISAMDGTGLGNLIKTIKESHEAYHHRIKTSLLNKIFEEIVYKNQPPAPHGNSIKLKYITQTSTAPPVFVVFVNRPELISDNYKKYLVRGLKEGLNLKGVPVRLYFRKQGSK